MKGGVMIEGTRAERIAVLAEWLTPREREVLGLYLAGNTMDGMAFELGLSTGGVASSLARIRVKYEDCGLTLKRKLGQQRIMRVRDGSEVIA